MAGTPARQLHPAHHCDSSTRHIARSPQPWTTLRHPPSSRVALTSVTPTREGVMARFNTRWRRMALVALAVTVGVTFAGWRAGTASAEPAPRLTAVEIADGVLFNDGPAAKYLTELDRPETQWTDEMRQIQEL